MILIQNKHLVLINNFLMPIEKQFGAYADENFDVDESLDAYENFDDMIMM